MGWNECLGWWRARDGARWFNTRRKDVRLIIETLAAAATWCQTLRPEPGAGAEAWLQGLDLAWRRSAAVELRSVLADTLDAHLAEIRGKSRGAQWREFVPMLAASAGWDTATTHTVLATLFLAAQHKGRAKDFAPLDDILLDSDFVLETPATAGIAVVCFCGQAGDDRLEVRVYEFEGLDAAPAASFGSCLMCSLADLPPT